MVAILYMILATAMFFLQDTYFLIGGVQFSFKNPCAIPFFFSVLIWVMSVVDSILIANGMDNTIYFHTP